MTDRRPLLLDLFCCAGGAAVGYHRAGFDVIGVDIEKQPNYPYEFIEDDALDVLRRIVTGSDDGLPLFSAVHASPPCQSYSAMTACRPGLAEQYPALVSETRDLLIQYGLPYVIENVVGAPVAGADDLWGAHGVTLCGQMFGLPLYRHRLFETSFPIPGPLHPAHTVPASKAGHWRPGTIISVSGNCSPIAVARTAMGIDWMNRNELAEAIPPAYTEFVGGHLMAHLRNRLLEASA